jgi:hypothetical protein
MLQQEHDNQGCLGQAAERFRACWAIGWPDLGRGENPFRVCQNSSLRVRPVS